MFIHGGHTAQPPIFFFLFLFLNFDMKDFRYMHKKFCRNTLFSGRKKSISANSGAVLVHVAVILLLCAEKEIRKKNE